MFIDIAPIEQDSPAKSFKEVLPLVSLQGLRLVVTTDVKAATKLLKDAAFEPITYREFLERVAPTALVSTANVMALRYASLGIEQYVMDNPTSNLIVVIDNETDLPVPAKFTFLAKSVVYVVSKDKAYPLRRPNSLASH